MTTPWAWSTSRRREGAAGSVPRSWLARLPTKHTVVRTANGSAVDVAWRGLRLQRAEIEMWPDVVLEQARCQSR